MRTVFQSPLLDLLIAVLCVWRLTHLLSVEEGPSQIITRFRRWLGDGFFGGLLDCFYCLSLWVALPLAFYEGVNWAQRLLLWPALSGAACLLEQTTKRPEFPGVYEDPSPSATEEREEHHVL